MSSDEEKKNYIVDLNITQDDENDIETWVFEQYVNNEKMNKEEYWKYAFTDDLETLQYIEKGTGSFTVIDCKKEKMQCPENKNNKIDFVYREVCVKPHQKFLNIIASHINDDKVKNSELEYTTLQNKFKNYKMNFENVFNKDIQEYIPLFKGEIRLEETDDSDHSFKQIVTIHIKLNLGTDDSWSLTNIAKSCVSYSVKYIFKKSIQNELQEMLEISPKCINEIKKTNK